MEKKYLAEKERKILEKAEEVRDFKINEYVGENKSFFNKFFDAQSKVNQKMSVLNDYYKVWTAVKDIEYKQLEAERTMDKKIYDLIFKTYQEIEKLTQKFFEVKTKFDLYTENDEEDE